MTQPLQAEDMQEMEQAPSRDTLALIFSTQSARPRVVWWLMLALPIFGQTFHYISALKPLWALSKAFPILSLPLMLGLARHMRTPITRQILLTFVWLLLVPSFSAIYYFHESFFTSITAQVKLLPLLYFFSFLSLLFILRPTLFELERSFMRMGIAIVVILILFWIFIPNSWYLSKYPLGTTPLFTDDNRGHRIRMSMYFPIIWLFFCYRRAWFERSFRYLLGALTALLVTLLIVRTRAMAIGIFAVVAINTIVWSKPKTRILMVLVIPFALAGIFSLGYLSSIFDTSAASGIDVRLISIQLASHFLSDSPLRWIFGVGTLSPTSRDSLIDYFNHAFFLADITWLGIVFEYGLIGAVLFVLIQVRGLLFYRRMRTEIDDDFLGALADYLIYVLAISPFYPPTLTPGESAVILAIFVYVWRSSGLEYRINGLRGPHAPSPTH